MREMIEIRPGRTLSITVLNKPAANKTTIFFLHGMGGLATQWRKQVTALQENYTLIVPDLLGQGQSEKAQAQTDINPYDFFELSKDIQSLFDRYATEQNIVLGHSYGGALAIYLAKNNASKIAKLILIAPLFFTPRVKIPFIYHLPPSCLQFMRPLLEKAFEKMAFAPTTSADLIKEEMQAVRVNSMSVIKLLIEGIRKMPVIEIDPINIPTLIIMGEYDHVTPNNNIKDFYRQLPNVRFAIINNAAHMMMLEKSAEVNKLIIDFISEN